MPLDDPITLSKTDLVQMRDAIIASISDRGQSEKKVTPTEGVIRELFDVYSRTPTRALTWSDLWPKCWGSGAHSSVENRAPTSRSNGRPKGEDEHPALLVRTTIYRARLIMGRYFKSPQGRAEPYRATIAPGNYRLTFQKFRGKKLSYAPEAPMRRSTTLGVLCRHSGDWFNSELLHGVHWAACQAGYNVLI